MGDDSASTGDRTVGLFLIVMLLSAAAATPIMLSAIRRAAAPSESEPTEDDGSDEVAPAPEREQPRAAPPPRRPRSTGWFLTWLSPGIGSTGRTDGDGTGPSSANGRPPRAGQAANQPRPFKPPPRPKVDVRGENGKTVVSTHRPWRR